MSTSNTTTKTVYTNGVCLFTLENFGRNTGAVRVNGISIHGHFTRQQARVAHSNGSLHRVFGLGDTKHLTALAMRRGMRLEGFEVC